jgi:hypothetical protein
LEEASVHSADSVADSEVTEEDANSREYIEDAISVYA